MRENEARLVEADVDATALFVDIAAFRAAAVPGSAQSLAGDIAYQTATRACFYAFCGQYDRAREMRGVARAVIVAFARKS